LLLTTFGVVSCANFGDADAAGVESGATDVEFDAAGVEFGAVGEEFGAGTGRRLQTSVQNSGVRFGAAGVGFGAGTGRRLQPSVTWVQTLMWSSVQASKGGCRDFGVEIWCGFDRSLHTSVTHVPISV
jgi:hypothetical protein